LRAVRDDSGLTAVEYAVLAGLVIVAGGIAAYSLGQGVHKSSGRVSWASGSSGSGHSSHVASSGPRLAVTPASSSGRTSILPWALLSLGLTVAGIGGFIGWHYLCDFLRQVHTRRIVRQSLSGAEGQAALQRLVRQPSREPIVRYKPVDTRLIGRNGPDLHHWVRGQDVSVSGDLASAGGRSIGPETDPQIMARLRPGSLRTSPKPAPPPAVPVAG
jgi:Flp pilus assembly pilin Flp